MTRRSPRYALHAGVRAVFDRFPRTRTLAIQALDGFYRLALTPFRRPRSAGTPAEAPDLVDRTDAFNEAAEGYFAGFTDREFLLNKPFSDPGTLAKHLIDTGLLIDGMRLRPGDVVAEIGAGSCWLSQFLNRFGCRTLAIDVSPTALALGRALFERDPRTNWALDPQFLPYDGHRLPLPDAACDRIVINDAFHHIPNQRELLEEMHRVLRPDGVVAMSEPGYGHGSAEQSVEEAATTGVLENELVLEDVAALARRCGFSAVNVIVASPFVRREIPARDLGRFMGGKGFTEYWKALCAGLEAHHYILCYKGDPAPTTVRPGRLTASIQIEGDEVVRLAAGQPPRARVRVLNAGDTRWLRGEAAGTGWTRIGAHLYEAAEPRRLVDFDWHRADLPRDVDPGQDVMVDLDLPPLPRPGVYLVVLDLVIEGMTWFADRGSRPATLNVRVE
jgi:SAM-dependent methyltransferase